MAFNIFTTKRISCFGLHAFTPPDPNSGLVHFLFPGGFGHARLRHFFLDAGECRFAEFFFTLLLYMHPCPGSRSRNYLSRHPGFRRRYASTLLLARAERQFSSCPESCAAVQDVCPLSWHFAVQP